MTRLDRLGADLGRVVTTHRWKSVVVGLVLAVLCCLGVTRARFSTDYRIFFSKGDPGLSAFEALEKVFTKTDNVLFVVKANDGRVFAPDALEALQELTDESWKLPFASRVDSLVDYPSASAVGDDIVVGAFVKGPARTLSAVEISKLERAVMAEPILVGSLVARDARTAAVNVTLRLPAKDPREVAEAADAARALALDVRARHPALDVRVSGMALVNEAFMQASIRDMGVMIPLMVVVVLAAMAFMTRSVMGTLASASVLAISGVMTMAFAGWMNYPLTPPAVAAPMIVLTMAVANGVHVVIAVTDSVAAGRSKKDAIALSLASNFDAITYSWLTTMVGFVCLNYSDAPPVTHLANMTAFGGTVAFVYSVTFLPALMALLPVRVSLRYRQRLERTSRRYDWLADLVMRRRGVILALAGAVTVAGGWEASRLETNDQFVRYFSASLPFRRDVEFTMKNLSGIYRLEYRVSSGESSVVADPRYLTRLDELAGWMRTQPEVEHVYALTDIVKRVNQVINDDDPAHYAIPTTSEAAGQALLLYEMGLPAGLELNDRISVDRAATRLSVTVKDLSTRELTAFARRSESWMRGHLPPPMWSEATGPIVIFSQLGDKNAKSMLTADFVSMGLIAVCMIVVLRDLRLGVLSMIPNVIPIVVGYGLWKLFVGQMNIVATVAASMALGVIVDDTIHLFTKYNEERRHGCDDPREAMRRTFAHVGHAAMSTNVVLVLGFGVLTFSSFQMTSYLGWLSLLIVALALVADLLVGPALVVTLHPRARRVARGQAPKSALDSPTELSSLQVGTR